MLRRNKARDASYNHDIDLLASAIYIILRRNKGVTLQPLMPFSRTARQRTKSLISSL